VLATEIVDQWPERTEDLPIDLRFSEDVKKRFGRVAVEYRFQHAVPLSTSGGDIAVPYFLVIRGPRLGRKEYALAGWPHRDQKQQLDRTPGIIFAPRNLKLSDDEPLEIYIERVNPHSSSRERVTNVVKVE
jgi:hypothetical protein